jgi:ubiquitin carboxyl-terminal hydrolase 9/13
MERGWRGMPSHTTPSASSYIKLTTGVRQGMSGAGSLSPKNKKEEPAPELTPLEKLLQNAGPIRDDGRDKFFGLENV